MCILYIMPKKKGRSGKGRTGGKYRTGGIETDPGIGGFEEAASKAVKYSKEPSGALMGMKTLGIIALVLLVAILFVWWIFRGTANAVSPDGFQNIEEDGDNDRDAGQGCQ
jgi:hypothetical protein